MLRKVVKIKMSIYPERATPLPFRYMEMNDSDAISQNLGGDRVFEDKKLNINDCRILADSFATDLAICLLDNLKHTSAKLSADGSLSDDFYTQCHDWLLNNDFITPNSDSVVITINLKQMMNILRTASIVKYDGEYAQINREFSSREELSKTIFDSFWNKTDWDKIFPSDPDAAIGLKTYRHVIMKLIQNQKRSTIEDLANNFFELTGFSNKNNLFMISFVDFYLFAWLKNFGFINYLQSNSETSVTIETTNFNKDILTSFIQNEMSQQ